MDRIELFRISCVDSLNLNSTYDFTPIVGILCFMLALVACLSILSCIESKLTHVK